MNYYSEHLRKSMSCVVLCLIVGCFTNANGQSKEVIEMWKNYTDSTKHTSILKHAQIDIDEESVLKHLDAESSFGIYRDNYFITGVPINKRIDKYNSDVKFQISIRQRLTKTILPFNTFLMLTYTQKSFWDVYADSSPFRDSNFNPGLMLAKPIVQHNKLKGMAYLAFEHESNGKDSIYSRSWNYFVLSGTYLFNSRLSIHGKVWGGWLSDDNSDLYDYKGFGMVGINYRSPNERLILSAFVNPRKQIWKVNTQMEASYRLTPKSNQFIFVQWYQGYAENLLEYDRYASMLRVGICIKPSTNISIW